MTNNSNLNMHCTVPQLDSNSEMNITSLSSILRGSKYINSMSDTNFELRQSTLISVALWGTDCWLSQGLSELKKMTG